MSGISAENIHKIVHEICAKAPVTDVHTHIYPPRFGELLLRGIDEILTYHYLVAEVVRATRMDYGKWWSLSKKRQAEVVWDELYVKRSPVSEACRGPLTCLKMMGLEDELRRRDLETIRKYFKSLTAEKHVEKVFELSGVTKVVMTNNPFDPLERKVWLEEGYAADPRFEAAFRMDDILVNWETSVPTLREWGYEVNPELSSGTVDELKRYLDDWTERMEPRYMAVSLPPEFRYPEKSVHGRILDEIVLPFCEQRGLPFAMMIGVRKLVNPGLQLAGDGVGKSDIVSVGEMARRWPKLKLLVTFLSRENIHEQAVYARKYPNLMVFGCWWFLNNPSLINEITRMRLELLGLSFIPQHSDARILDQLLYKWSHSRKLIAEALGDKYADIIATGWQVTRGEIERDVGKLFGGNFEEFLAD